MQKYLNTANAFNDFTSDIPEEKFYSKPSEKDIRHVRKILSDFRIKCDEIPDFDNICQLQRWLKGKIKDKLFEGVEDLK